MTAYYESAAGILLPSSRNGHGARSDAWTMLLESRIAELESRIQQEGWARLDDQAGREFNREAIEGIVDLARVSYLKNPLINRAVEIGALYVWGQDLSVSAEDERTQATIDQFRQDNRTTLTGQQASRLLEVELQVTGNVFLALFPDRAGGSVKVRTVPIEEIREIVCNPEDRYDPWYYRRRWQQRNPNGQADTVEVFYPDWRYQPTTKPATVNLPSGDVPIRWETPLLHVKVGAFPHWQWGVSEVYAALDWAKAYKEILEDDATRSRALARFAWRLTTTGGAQGVAAAKSRLGTTLGVGNGLETNPPPVTGSTFIAGKDIGMDPIRVAGATLDPDHSRPVRLMAAAALGLPETFFGDADVGNHATAKTLDRPTELRFNERRQLWRDVLLELLRWVIGDEHAKIEVSWPSLLEPDVAAQVDAIVAAATLKGWESAGTIPDETTSRLMLVAVGVEDVDEEVAKASQEREQKKQDAEQMAQQQQQQRQPGQGPAKPQPEQPIREADAVPVAITDDDIAEAEKFWDDLMPEYAGLLSAKAAG